MVGTEELRAGSLPARQDIIREYLISEMQHSLGSYSPACDRLAGLSTHLTRAADRGATSDALLGIVADAQRLNVFLRETIHRAGRQFRDSASDYFRAAGDAELSQCLPYMCRFYRMIKQATSDSTVAREFEDLRAVLRLPGAWHERDQGVLLLDQRLDEQIREFSSALGEKVSLPAEAHDAKRLLEADLDTSTATSKANVHVLRVMGVGHWLLHAHEAERSASVENRLKAAVEKEAPNASVLRTCAALFTWVYNVAFLVPWCFGATMAERERTKALLKDRAAPFSEVTHPVSYPSVSVADQVAVLALYRRGATRQFQGRTREAFCDYVKVQRIARASLRHVERAAVDDVDARRFFRIAIALADYRIGVAYRELHAHPLALEHFSGAIKGIDRVLPESENIRSRTHSRWIIRLHLERGWSYAKLGRSKAALDAYVCAWNGLTTLIAEQEGVQTRSEVTRWISAWLDERRYDPTIQKADLLEVLTPLVAAVTSTQVPSALHGLAAEILRSLGYLLATLRLGRATAIAGKPRRASDVDSAEPDGAAILFLAKALEYAPYDCRARTHLLSMSATTEFSVEALPQPPEPGVLEQTVDLGEAAEQAVHVYEQCVMREVLLPGTRGNAADARTLAARWLIQQMIRHPESSSSRLDRLYQLLRHERVPTERSLPERNRDADEASYRIEFVSCKRYSSFGPFVPRPTTFVPAGGGYFVRIHDLPVLPPPCESESADSARRAADVAGRRADRVFGIVVDPGMRFIRNLYQSGYSVSDIDMIIVTHDHVDHSASLDAILALLRQQQHWGRSPFVRSKHNGVECGRVLPVLCNRSVSKRYAAYSRTSDEYDAARFFSFEDDMEAMYRDPLVCLPRSFAGSRRACVAFPIRAMPMSGHTDSGRASSHALLFGSPGCGPSLAVTGDTPPPCNFQRDPWSAITSADVLIAHLGAIRMPQLAGLAALDVELSWLETAKPGVGAGGELYHRLIAVTSPHWPRLAGGTSAPPDNQLYFKGLWGLAREFARSHRPPTDAEPNRALLIVSEMREELGSSRVKVAAALNEKVPADAGTPPRALTADIGMRVLIDETGPRVLCSNCDLNNDYPQATRFHWPEEIREVCVKGEGDAIFYNCRAHDPGTSAFLERLQRFNPYAEFVFGRT